MECVRTKQKGDMQRSTAMNTHVRIDLLVFEAHVTNSGCDSVVT
jgi:hypothetical protein